MTTPLPSPPQRLPIQTWRENRVCDSKSTSDRPVSVPCSPDLLLLCGHMTSAAGAAAPSRSQSVTFPPPADDSLYESPEPFLTDDTSGSGGPALPRLSLPAATLLVLLVS